MAEKEYIERETAMEWVRALVDTMSVCTSIDECLGMKSMKSRALGALHDVPAADVRPVVRGKWEEWWPGDCALIMTGEEMLWMCSKCNAKFSEQSNFCPNCGADMREES